jgi:hypothetical protein
VWSIPSITDINYKISTLTQICNVIVHAFIVQTKHNIIVSNGRSNHVGGRCGKKLRCQYNVHSRERVFLKVLVSELWHMQLTGSTITSLPNFFHHPHVDGHVAMVQILFGFL